MDIDLFLIPRTENASYPPAIRLSIGVLTVGRTAVCEIFLPDPTVSRQHAQLDISPQRIVLTDLDSRNGTWVDNQRIQSTEVRIGQEIRFAAAVFVLTNDANTESGLLPEAATDVPRPKVKTRSPAESLTPRQLEVLGWLIQGLNEKEVATKLSISRETVHNHVRIIYSAYNVHSRVELLLKINPLNGDFPPETHKLG